MNSLSCATFCTLLLLPLWATSDESCEPDSTGITEGTIAKPIEQPGPNYPRSALRKGQEGWVELSYVIGRDGQVYDPLVEDSSGVREFEHEAIRTVERWRFEPATWDGRPIEQSQTKVRITFALEQLNNQRGASRKFIASDKKFSRFLEEGELAAAEKVLRELFEETGWNLYETTRLWISSYRLHKAQSDEPGQLMSISRAAAGREFVNPSEAADILVIKFYVEARLGKFSDAIETYESLAKEAPKAAEDDALVKVLNSIYEILDSDKALATNALIEGADGTGVWAHRLNRRKFAIDSIDGKIQNIDIRCDWRRANDNQPNLDQTWEVPESWGECRLFVHGGVGTSFRLIEMPNL